MANSVAFEYGLLDDQNIENWFRERGGSDRGLCLAYQYETLHVRRLSYLMQDQAERGLFDSTQSFCRVV